VEEEGQAAQLDKGLGRLGGGCGVTGRGIERREVSVCGDTILGGGKEKLPYSGGGVKG